MIKKYYIPLMYVFCFISIALFLFYDHFDSPVKKQFYYVWIKTMEFLLVTGYVFILKGVIKKIAIVGSVFYGIRLVWQVFEIENYSYANKPYVIDYLFILCMLSIGCIIFIPEYYLKKNRKKDGRN